ncbi:SGNH/GDSL hydrolase family protein [Methylonatrum kenyense]|uniref:SGNH/GDSL hydrolase family protein n=1 Tax=Methylonatrum kenyense TaxID=455253 RepID=UPI0020BDAF58|nr:SGNH/GDSL hydrolase family protein [Methylonatrum kenyense]MCK8516794.1 SGNH/GDSL hydrolase family protein [Methylonatrum kenyense]
MNKPYTSTFRGTLAVLLGTILCWTTGLTAGDNLGSIAIGVMGDSNSDEYRADDNRGGAFSEVTLNWVEIMQRTRDVDFGPWGNRREPRRTGYAYNWARSGARAADLDPQARGLARQVRAGDVDYVLIHIGTNDFHPNSSYGDVYHGRVSGTELEQKILQITSDIRSAISLVRREGANVVVTGVPDPGLYPEFQQIYPDAQQRQSVSNAIDRINDSLAADAEHDPRITYVDMDVIADEIMARADDGSSYILVGNQRISRTARSNDPSHLQLDDNAGHGGTVVNGLLANTLFITPLNESFGLDIPQLSDEEILCIAGLKEESACATSPE